MNITKDHITKYLTGELPYYEQYELEKMMLDDPFLSDAIDGLLEINDPDKLNDALLEIEGLIESNYGKRRVLVPIYKNPLAIAAVISLLIISVAIVLLVPDYRQKVQSFLISGSEMKESELPESRKQEELITEKDEPVEEQIASPDSGISSIEEEQPALITLDADPGSEDLVETTPTEEPARLAFTDTTTIDEENLLIAEQEDPTITPIIVDSVSTTLATNEMAGEADQVEELTVAEGVDISGDVAAKRAATESRAQLRETPAIKEVSGVVTSTASNQPIAGVNVILGGTPKGTITDANGRYNLQVDEGINTIQYSYIGFRPTNLNLTNTDDYNVGLSPDAQQLSEVMVIGYGGADNRTQGSDKFAEPGPNRNAYNSYLRDNLIYPDSAANNNITGIVVVQFNVGIDGSISNLEISSSLGYGCDEEAIRLIQEGPGWRPAIRNGSFVSERVRVAVRFNP